MTKKLLVWEIRKMKGKTKVWNRREKYIAIAKGCVLEFQTFQEVNLLGFVICSCPSHIFIEGTYI